MNTKFIEECLSVKTKNNVKMDPLHFAVLKGEDVISARISDHHPVIHSGALFWNIMMRGRLRQVKNVMSYNNGFGIVENEPQYMERLTHIAYVIVEIISRYPSIKTIGLCEGPIETTHVNVLLAVFKKFPCMQRFLKMFHSPSNPSLPNWGLLMLADKKYTTKEVPCDFIENSGLFYKLANRFQMWKLTCDHEEKYFALAHFPFGGDEFIAAKDKLSELGKFYCKMINNLMTQYAHDDFMLCADFNLNPYLINEYSDRVMDKIESNNSIVLTSEQNIRSATVDGILLSLQEKQRYSSSIRNKGLVSSLIREHGLFQQDEEMLEDTQECKMLSIRAVGSSPSH